MRKLGEDREPRLVGLDRVLQDDVEHGLIPDQVRRGREGRPEDVLECAVEGDEGPIRGERDSGRHDFGALHKLVVLEQLQVVDEPEDGGVAQIRIRLLDHDVAGTAEWELDVAHRSERDADQHPEDVALSPDIGLDRDGCRDLVRGGDPGGS